MNWLALCFGHAQLFIHCGLPALIFHSGIIQGQYLAASSLSFLMTMQASSMKHVAHFFIDLYTNTFDLQVH